MNASTLRVATWQWELWLYPARRVRSPADEPVSPCDPFQLDSRGTLYLGRPKLYVQEVSSIDWIGGEKTSVREVEEWRTW